MAWVATHMQRIVDLQSVIPTIQPVVNLRSLFFRTAAYARPNSASAVVKDLSIASQI